tara:strand:- start:331 stop:552 length:222 start_codon:yes stop_codon:yes gene_type:complete
MEHFIELINLVDSSIKNNIKEGDYLILMRLIRDIYRTKEVEKIHTISEDDLTDEDEEDTNNIYGDYNDIYSSD